MFYQFKIYLGSTYRRMGSLGANALRLFGDCADGTAFLLRAITTSIHAFPMPSGTSAKCCHYLLLMTKNMWKVCEC